MVSSAAWRGRSKLGGRFGPGCILLSPSRGREPGCHWVFRTPAPLPSCKGRFAVGLAELTSLVWALAAQAALVLRGLLPSPATMGGAGGSDQLRKTVIPVLPGQAGSNVKGGGFGAVILAGGFVHLKSSIFWRQIPGYQSLCREGWISLITGPSLPLGIHHHFPHTGQARKCQGGTNHPAHHLRATLAPNRCARPKGGS